MFKYKTHFEKLNLMQCPPPGCQNVHIKAFRYCQLPCDNEINLMPQAIKIERGIIPPRSFEKPTQKCADFGISLFDSKESATKFYFGILRPIVREKLGYTHISTGEIKKEDGVITEVEKSGHFNLHEYASSVCLKNFILVEALQESHGNC